ncbi:hypothetical protein [Umezawaea sp. Da 62-37]|nr:hypothetical protein [Umezawaea sp. Da 62-37]WNV86667.1 hypothetical protein RM788_52570 [Umezawaea sp. Da 62-37]WNV86750.1 hypothetical protein RM788_00235 [Umezawaea sp. Da 62-37]
MAGTWNVVRQRFQNWTHPNRTTQVMVTVGTVGSATSTWSPSTRGA